MSASRTKKKRQRTHRYTSNVFSMFSQDQIQEFKEAFNMIDQNRDGFIDKDDLIEMLTSLGKNPDDPYVDLMVTEAPGPINFTMFLTLFGEKLNGTDPEDVIRNAFGCFDLKSLGYIPEDELREIMTTMGDRWEDSKVDELLNGAPIQNGLFDYIEFTRTLKHGAREKDGERHPADPPASPSPIKPPPQMVFPPQKQIDKKPQPKQIDNLKPKSSLKQSTKPQSQPPKPLEQPPKPQEHAKPPAALKQPMKLDAVPKKSSLKPSPKSPKPSMSGDSTSAPPLPKSAPPPQPASPESNSSTGEGREMKTSPFGAVLKSTGKLPPYKKF